MNIISVWRPIFLLLSLMVSWQSFAKAPVCAHIFQDPQVLRVDGDFKVNSGNKRDYETPREIIQYHSIKMDLWSSISTLPKDRQKQVEHLLSSVEFFDYTHTAPQILTNLLKGTKEPLNFESLYDRYGEVAGAPFKGFLNARDNFLRKKRPEVTPELLLNIHTQIMKDGVEGVSLDQLGKWRNGHWMGNSQGDYALTKAELNIIESNRYLYFEKYRETTKQRDSFWDRIKIWGKNKQTVSFRDSTPKVEGIIHYPNVLESKIETLNLIKDTHPKLHKALIELRSEGRPRGPPTAEMEFTKALVENRFAEFNRDREALGEIQIGKNEQLYIDLVADFQRDLVAIHPVLNGNGRTTRLLMNYLLTKEGLPPVRLVDPFLDVQVSKEAWRQYVHKGVLNSAQLQADIAYRIKHGLSVELSPELIYPGLPELISISSKKQGSNRETPNQGQVKLESEQFSAFLLTLSKEHPDLVDVLITKDDQRLEAMSRLADLFVEFQRSKTIRYIHDKDGVKDIKLRLIEPEFIESFGSTKFHDKELWNQKIDQWYERDTLVWRGLSSRQYEYNTADLILMFTKPTTHLSSVNSSRQSGRHLLDSIKQDFFKYNKELLSGDLVDMAIDHHRSGPRYGNSYGFSTSKREVVGKAFAMGAMVVGEYGKHMDSALQAQLKSRINVAHYKSTKDVDLGRLKAFDESFSYIYGRQAEVMGIGGTDPDAVMLIQRLNAQGKVIETLMRNPLKPNEVFRIKGRYVPSEGPLDKALILETIKLR